MLSKDKSKTFKKSKLDHGLLYYHIIHYHILPLGEKYTFVSFLLLEGGGEIKFFLSDENLNDELGECKKINCYCQNVRSSFPEPFKKTWQPWALCWQHYTTTRPVQDTIQE
jgi:hypothetical protein